MYCVDVLAESLDRAVVLCPLLLGDKRRAREGDAGRIGEGLEQVVAQIGALGAVGLVNHQQDALGQIDDTEGLARRDGLVSRRWFGSQGNTFGIDRRGFGFAQRLGHGRRQGLGTLDELVRPSTMFTSDAAVRRCSRSWAVLSMTLTLPPMSLAVPASWSSRSIRSLTSSILKSSRSAEARSMRATKTMVSDLPEPWVCQTTPERASGGLAGPQTSDDLVGGPVLLVAAHDLDAAAGIGVHEHGAGAQDIEQRRRGEQPLNQLLLFALDARAVGCRRGWLQARCPSRRGSARGQR